MKHFTLISGNPAWAAQYIGGPVNNPQDLVDFIAALAERYDGDGNQDADGRPIIEYFSLYGEPDNSWAGLATTGKGYWGNDPAGYADLLRQVSLAVHAANPNARVLIGGVAYDWFTTDNPPGPFVQSFLADVLTTLNTYPGGVTNYLDAIAIHYYPISLARWPTIREKVAEIQSILNAHGAGSLPLLVPEMGYWTDPSAGSSETMQARTLVQMFIRGLSMGIDQLSWYAVFDVAPTGSETVGLFRNGDLSQPRPSYTAYATMANELFQYSFVRNFTAPGAEGYVFERGGREKTVAWARTNPVTVAFALACVRQVDLLGGVQLISDGGPGDGDGAANGQVRVSLAVNHPVYVGACP
jgi:hypothetical protein